MVPAVVSDLMFTRFSYYYTLISVIEDADLLAGLVICVTGSTKGRAVVECRGGVYMVSNKCTHLLVWTNTGILLHGNYSDNQLTYGTVHPKWLLDSIDKNEVQSEVDYFVHTDGMYIILMHTHNTCIHIIHFSFIDDDYYPPGPNISNFRILVTVNYACIIFDRICGENNYMQKGAVP